MISNFVSIRNVSNKLANRRLVRELKPLDFIVSVAHSMEIELMSVRNSNGFVFLENSCIKNVPGTPLPVPISRQIGEVSS